LYKSLRDNDYTMVYKRLRDNDYMMVFKRIRSRVWEMTTWWCTSVWEILNDTKQCVNRNHNPIGNYKIECRATQTSDKCEGRIRCRGGVSILCWPVTPTVRPLSKLGIRDYPLSKTVWKWQFNKLYETNHSAYGPVIICNCKQGHYNDRRTCEMMTSNEIHYNPATSTFL
jgi:hypothetical protein